MKFKSMPTTPTGDMISSAYTLLDTLPLDTPDRQRKAVIKVWQIMAENSPPPPRVGLSVRQRQAFEVISDFIADNAQSPSYEQIGGQLGMTKSQVHGIVKALQRRGYITYKEGRRRSIQLVPDPKPPVRKP